jgi:hypothetical protein
MIDVGRYLGINAWINRQAWLGRGFWINEDDNIIFIEFLINHFLFQFFSFEKRREIIVWRA